MDLRIPAGVDDGTRLRVAGEGGVAARGSAPGDLYVILKIREHAFFERRGNDLYYTIPVSISQAALGAEIMVPTLRGEERLRIPEGTQSGSVFRLRGLGMPALETRSHGDLYRFSLRCYPHSPRARASALVGISCSLCARCQPAPGTARRRES